MDGLNQLTAADHTIAVGGRTYRMSPLTLKDYGEIENRILAKRPDPLAAAIEKLQGLGRKQQEFLLGRAYDRAVSARYVTAEELDHWRRTREGFCYLFWLMLRKHQPEISLEEAGRLLEQLTEDAEAELAARMEDCNGLPEGNPSSRAQQPAT